MKQRQQVTFTIYDFDTFFVFQTLLNLSYPSSLFFLLFLFASLRNLFVSHFNQNRKKKILSTFQSIETQNFEGQNVAVFDVCMTISKKLFSNYLYLIHPLAKNPKAKSQNCVSMFTVEQFVWHSRPAHPLHAPKLKWIVDLQIMSINFTPLCIRVTSHSTQQAPRHHHCSW